MALKPDDIVRLHLGKLWLADLKLDLPVHGFLVKHPGGAGLVDTGYGNNTELIKEYRAVAVPVASALAVHGISPIDIRWVINSHLHFDHAGQNAVFPHAPLYVQRGEHKRIHEENYTVAEWLDYAGARYELLEGEAEIVPGVRVITTPGHTPGHQSIVVATASGPSVIVGDACWTVDHFEGIEPPAGSMEDMKLWRQSVDKLHQQRPSAVHFCHDPRTWQPAVTGSRPASA